MGSRNCWSVQAAFDFAFLVKGELLAQKQILGRERTSRAQAETRKQKISPRILNQFNHTLMLQEILGLVRRLLKICRNHSGFKQGEMFLRTTAGVLAWQRPFLFFNSLYLTAGTTRFVQSAHRLVVEHSTVVWQTRIAETLVLLRRVAPAASLPHRGLQTRSAGLIIHPPRQLAAG